MITDKQISNKIVNMHSRVRQPIQSSQYTAKPIGIEKQTISNWKE